MKIQSGIIFLILTFLMSSCSQYEFNTGIDETGNETAESVEPSDGGSHDFSSIGISNKGKQLKVSQDTNVRYLKNNILEAKTYLPNGTQIVIPENFETVHYDYRGNDGKITRSSTGFIANIQIVSVPEAYRKNYPDSLIKNLNATSGGLYISASLLGTETILAGDNYAVVKASTPGTGFLKNFHSTGQPKFNYRTSVTKRFGDRFNKGIDPNSLSSADRAKWQKIFTELQKAVNRKVETKKAYLIMNKAQAVQASIDFEKLGVISKTGAWSVAVSGTATRHGFSNVPCAEFQSELLRQAYARAGYTVTNDFNKTKGNPLIWSNTAAVVKFSQALYRAGWVPWDYSKYRAPVGAFMMHGSGQSPGHTYIAAGDNGQVIVDNGAPQGRDLRKTSESTINMMFRGGVFFLPPGINPQPW